MPLAIVGSGVVAAVPLAAGMGAKPTCAANPDWSASQSRTRTSTELKLAPCASRARRPQPSRRKAAPVRCAITGAFGTVRLKSNQWLVSYSGRKSDSNQAALDRYRDRCKLVVFAPPQPPPAQNAPKHAPRSVSGFWPPHKMRECPRGLHTGWRGLAGLLRAWPQLHPLDERTEQSVASARMVTSFSASSSAATFSA